MHRINCVAIFNLLCDNGVALITTGDNYESL